MDDFLTNLLQALRIIVLELESMTMVFNNTTISVMDCIEYSMIIYTTLWFIKSMSYDGLFTISKSKRESIHEGRFKKE